MSAKRKKRKGSSFYAGFAGLVIVPLLLVNLYAAWKINQIAEWVEVPLFGSFYSGPAQLTTLLLLNCGVVLLLLIFHESK